MSVGGIFDMIAATWKRKVYKMVVMYCIITGDSGSDKKTGGKAGGGRAEAWVEQFEDSAREARLRWFEHV